MNDEQTEKEVSAVCAATKANADLVGRQRSSILDWMRTRCAMDVKELIELLQTFPLDMEVVVPGMDGIGAIGLKCGIRIVEIGPLRPASPFGDYSIRGGGMAIKGESYRAALLIGETGA